MQEVKQMSKQAKKPGRAVTKAVIHIATAQYFKGEPVARLPPRDAERLQGALREATARLTSNEYIVMTCIYNSRETGFYAAVEATAKTRNTPPERVWAVVRRFEKAVEAQLNGTPAD